MVMPASVAVLVLVTLLVAPAAAAASIRVVTRSPTVDAAGVRRPYYVRASFEAPVLVGQSTTGYYHFPSQVMWLRGEGEFNDTLVMAVSTSFDTVKPCTANCSRLMRSTDGGRSWALGLTNPTHAALPRLSARDRGHIGAVQRPALHRHRPSVRRRTKEGAKRHCHCQSATAHTRVLCCVRVPTPHVPSVWALC